MYRFYARHFLYFITAVSLLFSVSCKRDNETLNMASVKIKLTDKPISGIKELNIHIREILYHTAGGNQSSGWQTITNVNMVYDVLKLANGKEKILTSASLPAGKVTQIRLVLGTNNTLKDSLGNIHVLTVPSGSESGLKVQVNETLVKDMEYSFLLDFDAAKSVLKTGSNTYILKPVLRLIVENITGGIKGVVSPKGAQPVVVATLGTDSASTICDSLGNYLIKGLTPGTYKLDFYPKLPYPDTSVSGINVAAGAITWADTLKY